MVSYKTGAILAIAASGKNQPETDVSPFGEIRSRDGAMLRFTQNDIQELLKKMLTHENYIDGEIYTEKLVNPSKELVINTIGKLAKNLARSSFNKGITNAFYLIFAGHGSCENGALEVIDGNISATEVLTHLTQEYNCDINRLHINLILDSCYSSRFLIDLMVESQDKLIYPYDCFVSSLPDEKSWELNVLQHGALSFHLVYQGNSYVNTSELAKAIDEQQWGFIAKSLQGVAVPNPVTFLTGGRQHSVRLTSGHYLEVQGAGSVELADYEGKFTRMGLAECLRNAKTAYGQTISYEADC